MLSIKVLFVLLAVMLLFMETKTTSAASIVKDVDGREKNVGEKHNIFISENCAPRDLIHCILLNILNILR